jgi:hypothetical protein
MASRRRHVRSTAAARKSKANANRGFESRKEELAKRRWELEAQRGFYWIDRGLLSTISRSADSAPFAPNSSAQLAVPSTFIRRWDKLETNVSRI